MHFFRKRSPDSSLLLRQGRSPVIAYGQRRYFKAADDDIPGSDQSESGAECHPRG